MRVCDRSPASLASALTAAPAQRTPNPPPRHAESDGSSSVDPSSWCYLYLDHTLQTPRQYSCRTPAAVITVIPPDREKKQKEKKLFAVARPPTSERLDIHSRRQILALAVRLSLVDAPRRVRAFLPSRQPALVQRESSKQPSHPRAGTDRQEKEKGQG